MPGLVGDTKPALAQHAVYAVVTHQLRTNRQVLTMIHIQPQIVPVHW